MNRLKPIYLWYWLFAYLLRRGPVRTEGFVGNRHTWKGTTGPVEIEVVIRDTRQPDGYSREELYQLLKLIRREEKRSEWKVPDDDGVKPEPREVLLSSAFVLIQHHNISAPDCICAKYDDEDTTGAEAWLRRYKEEVFK